MKALLIIDMQNISFTPETPRFDSENVIEKINQLSSLFRKNNDLVVFIQHDGSRLESFKPNTIDWDILTALNKQANDLVISKTANDSFYNSKLKSELTNKGINEIVVSGCATDFCVDATIKTALVNDFNITVISDAHTTADRPMLKAKQIIDYYNWLWSEFFETKGKISVMSFAEYTTTL